MTQLVSRDAVVATLRDALDPKAFESIETSLLVGIPTVKPRIVCDLEGGLIETVYADCEAEVTILDSDLDCLGNDDMGIELPDGTFARRVEQHVHVDPDHIDFVAQAPEVELNEADDE